MDCIPSTSNVVVNIDSGIVQFPSTSSSMGDKDKQLGYMSSGIVDNPLSAYSPNFNICAIGNEAEKLKWLVLKHVEPTLLKRMFAPLMSNPGTGVNRTDELTCEQACNILKVLEPLDKSKPPTELEQACYGLIGLLSTEKKYLRSLDQIITRIIITAAEQKIIALLLACQLLVSSIDFRMLTPPNPEKIQFVRKSMDQMDYKNMRDLVRLLLVEKLDKMPCKLTEQQHSDLYAIEQLVIDLIDRRKNFCPALFFITEISRIDTDHSSIHFLPRVSLKIREMVASFRPLAEIGCMLGRGWMWPVPASPLFSWSSPTWSAWKLDEKNGKLHFKTHLPYNSENSSAQSYLQYILLKQPHGQDNLNHIIRTSSTGNQTPVARLQCDELIQLFILEAMCAMEDSNQPVLAPVNQYNWLHLSHLVTYALLMGHCTLSKLLSELLLPELKNCQYLRAKEELMWILLQYIAYTKSKEKQIQQHLPGILPGMGGLCHQNWELVLNIFNVLYIDKSMNWGDTCSTEQPLNMVRFFAPAAIWINLVNSPFGSNISNTVSGDQLPQPPEKLRTMIDFIEKQIQNNEEKNMALLAVVANAYSNDAEVFEKHVNNSVFRMLGAQQHQQQERWTLPGGSKTEPFLRALELTFLDSLTFHAKQRLYTQLLILNLKSPLQQPPDTITIWRLPSPALIETIARLLLSTELCDQNEQLFVKAIIPALKILTTQRQLPPESARMEPTVIFLELLNYRLPTIGFGWKYDFSIRSTLLFFVLEQLLFNPLFNPIGPSSNPPNCLQMSQLLEQTVLRFVLCTSPHDLLSTMSVPLSEVLEKTLGKHAKMTMLEFLQKIFTRLMKDFPELYRAYLLSIFRATKLLGDSGQLRYLGTELGGKWPHTQLQWFPPSVQQILIEQSAQREQDECVRHQQQMLELEKIVAQEMQYLLAMQSQTTQVYYDLNQQPPALFISIFRCVCQFKNYQLPPSKPGHPNFYAKCYKILSQLSNKDLHKLTNAFADWLASKYGWVDEEPQIPQMQTGELDFDSMLLVLNDMLFVHQFISAEQFLFSIAMHPTDDHETRVLLYILAALLDRQYSELSKRLHACYAFIPAHSKTSCSDSENFFIQMNEYSKKYPEYSYAELYRQAQAEAPTSIDVQNLPTYYGHLAERICPIVDFLLQRALETDVKPLVLDSLLHHFSPIYRIHPVPITFLYKTLYILDNMLLARQQQQDTTAVAVNQSLIDDRPVRKFVLEIVLKLEHEEQGMRGQATQIAGKFLSLEFIQQDHQMPPIKFCRVLVDRIVRASTYTHQPPSFIQQDWRFAEFSPAAQALTCAWVELLASRHSPIDIVDALVQLALHRSMPRPVDTLNALGLLLTGLPALFQTAFLDKIEQSFDWEQIAAADADPAQLFESFSHEVFLHSSSRILSMLALIHSFCQHGGNNSLSIIPDLIVQKLAPKVQNEAQLLYFLRIVVPYLQRIHEKERSRHMTEIVTIYQVLGNLTQKIGQLRYEDTICDLLYQFKYMFVGYLLKEQTEQPIRSFPDSMREKLKFLLTHSSSVATLESQQQMQQILQMQGQSFPCNIPSAPQTQPNSTVLNASQMPPPQFSSMEAAAMMTQQQQQQHTTAPSSLPYAHPGQMLATMGVQQPPPFAPPIAQFHNADQPALLGTLQQRQSSGSIDSMGGPPQSTATGQIPSGIIPGQQQQQQEEHQLEMFTAPLTSLSSTISPNVQQPASHSSLNMNTPGSIPISAPGSVAAVPTTGGQHLAPPPPYPMVAGGQQQQIGSVQMLNSPFAHNQMPSVPLTTASGQIVSPAHYQQMMDAQQQQIAAAAQQGRVMQTSPQFIPATTTGFGPVGGVFRPATTAYSIPQTHPMGFPIDPTHQANMAQTPIGPRGPTIGQQQYMSGVGSIPPQSYRMQQQNPMPNLKK